MSANVTVLGLGSMGTALAGAFLSAGHRTTVWNRTPGKAGALVARGAAEAAAPAGAVAASELVVVCLATYETVHQVLDPVAGGLAGRTLVNLTSGTPEEARGIAAWAAGHGAEYLDGGIMTTPPGIGNPDFMLLYSGPRSVFDARRPVLAALGDPVHLGEDTGLASLYDTALLGLMWSALTGWLHGAALVGADGGERATAFTRVANRWMKAVEVFMNTYAPQVDAGKYPGDDATLDVHAAAIEHLVHASEARGIASGLPEIFQDLTRRGIEAGHGRDSWARLVELVREDGRK
ncbi:NAD(P)-dependent oxidoreductase [Streptomyces sp. AV19]|uniref:NAD(P)-dependent oxidoreductase n=1 Tax=Streptomyces sp. AV19 TaxID=2793068 RepID=UPI0018FEA495|nr:NAD(P)-binding domain-containing protein [Streptomyces sp. AV19]MBH1933632.1 NAD(P)-dependent oxidoreductase [Streptomyces sp. AV19]MDG4535862.1 NAD(P)-binding domain-containing protein [Streptomyces sp. AV19]